MELLETRLHYAVTVSTTGKYIRITGDAGNDLVDVRPNLDDAGDYIGPMFLFVQNATVDGGPNKTLDDETTPGLRTKPWIVDLGGGDDYFSIASFSLQTANTTIKFGAGDDRLVTGTDISYSSLAIDAGPGNDDIKVGGGTTYLMSLSVFGGPGRDKIAVNSGHVAGQLQIQDASGPSNINCSLLSVSKETFIVTGNSIDHLLFDRCSFGRHVLITTRGADDTIYSVSSRFKAGADVFAGGDDDQVVGFD